MFLLRKIKYPAHGIAGAAILRISKNSEFKIRRFEIFFVAIRGPIVHDYDVVMGVVIKFSRNFMDFLALVITKDCEKYSH